MLCNCQGFVHVLNQQHRLFFLIESHIQQPISPQRKNKNIHEAGSIQIPKYEGINITKHRPEGQARDRLPQPYNQALPFASQPASISSSLISMPGFGWTYKITLEIYKASRLYAIPIYKELSLPHPHLVTLERIRLLLLCLPESLSLCSTEIEDVLLEFSKHVLLSICLQVTMNVQIQSTQIGYPKDP